MKTFFKIFTVILFLFIGGAPLWAQSGKYVVSAELRISLTHQLWPDVFLNGHPIVDSQDHVFDPTSNIDQRFSKDQLCYFTSTNCLAIRVPQTLGSTAGTNATIGLAYVLKIVFSDHTTHWIASGQGKTSWCHVKKNGRDPSGWMIAGFEDEAWAAAKTFKPASMAVTLINPPTRAAAKYFPTFQDNANVYSTLGERIFFRSKFSMDITTPPGCGGPAPLAPRKVQPAPSPAWTPQPTSTFTPWSTSTPQLVWTPRRTLTPVPVWTDTASPTATSRPWIPKPTSTLTPTPTLIFSLPTNTPTRPPRPTRTPLTVRKKRLPPTLTLNINGNHNVLLAQPRLVTVTATFTPAASQDLSIATTIVFDNPPVNIDASFADGPGLYKLEIVDAQGLHLNTLYNKPSGFEKEIWITWDGTNDQGQLLRYGNYYALFTKDGILIQKIALIWIQPGKTGNSAD